MRWSEHWERARLDAEITNDSALQVKASNVNAFTLSFGPAARRLGRMRSRGDHQRTEGHGRRAEHGRILVGFVSQNGDKWTRGRSKDGVRKKHGLQGPIDDAFMNGFVFVKPSGTPAIPAMAKWVESEQNHAIKEWRRQFRGEAQVRKDSGFGCGHREQQPRVCGAIRRATRYWPASPTSCP